jgi:hypothetical protein
VGKFCELVSAEAAGSRSKEAASFPLRKSRLWEKAAGPSEAFGWLLTSKKLKLLPKAKPKAPLSSSFYLLMRNAISKKECESI